MFPLLLGLAAAGAATGALTGNKKDRSKRALIGAGLGALGGIGAGMMGVGAGASSSVAGLGSASQPLLAPSMMGGASSAPLASSGMMGEGFGALTGSGSTGMMTGGATSSPSFMRGLMTLDPKGNALMQGGKQMVANNLLSGLMGGGEQASQPIASAGIPYNPPQYGGVSLTPVAIDPRLRAY